MYSPKLGVERLGEFNYTSLLAGDLHTSTAAVILSAGSVYPVGSVLGRATDTGMCSLVDSSKTDGTEKVYAVLAETVDATEGDVEAIGYLTGEFVQARLTFGGADTWETHKDAARAVGIFFKSAALQPNQ